MLTPRRAAPATQLRWPRMTDRYRLGAGAGVSPICLGVVGDPDVVLAAFDAGVSFFFVSADLHWPLYEHTRRGLARLFARGGGVRDEVTVGVVSYVAQPQLSRGAFHEVVAAIPGLGRVDVAILGAAYARDFTPRLRAHRREHMDTAIGVTFHDRPTCRRAVDADLIDIGFVRYNPGHRGAERDVFARLRRDGAALLYNFKSTDFFLREAQYASLGIAPDYWRPRRTDYYRFALSRPQVDGLLCSLDTERHVSELADALEAGPLEAAEADYLCDLADLQLGVANLATP